MNSICLCLITAALGRIYGNRFGGDGVACGSLMSAADGQQHSTDQHQFHSTDEHWNMA